MMGQKLLATIAVSLVLLGNAPIAVAQQDAARTLDELLQSVRQSGSETSKINQQREQEFRTQRDQQQAILRRTQAEIAQAEARSEQLKRSFDNNEQELESLSETLRIRVGDMGELFGVVRQVAGDTKGIVENSLVSAQMQDRGAAATTLAKATGLPSIADLRSLQALLLEEMVESGKVVRFERDVEDAAGITSRSAVVRVGVFNAINENGYLTFDASDASLRELPRQPASRYLNTVEDFYETSSGNTALAVDPSRGALLSLVIQSPGFLEQVSHGGLVGYTIILLGIIGMAIALIRLIYLQIVGGKIRKQLKSDEADSSNPLGRILAVYDINKTEDVSNLELALDFAIVKETPRLERLQGTIKVFAGIAPLMGLLGTVVGMIRTFQSITLFGTGDPKLMADGISQALVTTVEGLVVAIPLVFLHAIVSGKSRTLIEILEEQSAGLVAKRAEMKV